MDKSLIINKIKDYLNFKTDKELAEFLGIKQNTLSTWRSRNTLDYDLIISKCDFLDANWLLTGKGSMLLSQKEERVNEDEIMYDLSSKDKKIESLEKLIQEKDSRLQAYLDIIHLHKKLIDILKNE